MKWSSRIGGLVCGLLLGGLAGVFFGIMGWGVNEPGFSRAIIAFSALGGVIGALLGVSSEADQSKRT